MTISLVAATCFGVALIANSIAIALLAWRIERIEKGEKRNDRKRISRSDYKE